jgi:hypothetical protein
VFSAASVIVMIFPASRLMNVSSNAARYDQAAVSTRTPGDDAAKAERAEVEPIER